jgi:hypothetical protein
MPYLKKVKRLGFDTLVSGGTIGREISVYRELMPGANLDAEAVKSLQFLRNLL